MLERPLTPCVRPQRCDKLQHATVCCSRLLQPFAMADMNEDKMKAKAPLWFQKILGWESRLLVRLEKSKCFFGPVLCFVE
jgi:hypothetical protein